MLPSALEEANQLDLLPFEGVRQRLAAVFHLIREMSTDPARGVVLVREMTIYPHRGVVLAVVLV